MQTECSADLFGFARVKGRAVVAAFDGGTITSDAGALLLGAADRTIGLIDRFAGCFLDSRAQELVEHEVPTLVSRSIRSACLGGASRPRAWNDQRKEACHGEGAETIQSGSQKAEAAEVGKENGFNVAATRAGAQSGKGAERPRDAAAIAATRAFSLVDLAGPVQPRSSLL